MVPDPVTVKVPSKINLHLAVGDDRGDGYHELTTVFQATSLVDEVMVVADERGGVEVYGEGEATVSTGRDNLAWQAVLALAEYAGRDTREGGPNVRVIIRKSIPVSGGMAGGSADAAAALVGVTGLWGLNLSRDELATVGSRLGSDVPFALHGGTALGTGRGEELVPVLCGHTYHWVLAFGGDGLSTPRVYGELDRLRAEGDPPRVGSHTALLEALASGDPRRVALLLGNDLQAAAVSLRPALRRTLRAGVAAGALAGIVSGSGPTCAFLCADAEGALEVAAELAGAGVCRTVRVAQSPVPGARASGGDDDPPATPPQVHA